MSLASGRACVFGNHVYVFGGDSGTAIERSILTYDTTSNSWSAKSPMPHARYAFECAVVGGAAYLVGGFGLTDIFGAVERYDPFVETWSTPTRLNTPRHGLSTSVVGTRIFTIGGNARGFPLRSDYPVDAVEILDTEKL